MTEADDNSTTATTQTGPGLKADLKPDLKADLKLQPALDSISNFQIIERYAWEPIYIYPKDSFSASHPDNPPLTPPQPVELFVLGIKNERAVIGVLIPTKEGEEPSHEIKPTDYKPMPDWLIAMREGVLRGDFSL